jgi:hypothetical protein
MLFKEWNTADLVRQLKALGFGQYCQEFQMNEITGLHLPLLTEDHLKEIGVSSVGHRILMLRRFSDIVLGKDTRQPPPRPADAAKPAARKPDPIPAERPKPALVLSRNVDARFDLSDASSDGCDPPRPAFAPPPQPKRADAPKSPTKKPEPAALAGAPKKAEPPVPQRRPEQTLPPKRTAAAVAAGAQAKPEGRFDAYQAADASGQAGAPDARRSVARSGFTEALCSRRPAEPAPAEKPPGDGLVTCDYCGRRLQPEAAKRHIPVCAKCNSGRAPRR